jgi:DNA ligase (NAD+)
VVRAILEKRPPEAEPFSMPSQCPVCGSEAARLPGEAASRCQNASCPAQLKEHIFHFGSKNALDIDGLGRKLVDLLVDRGFVENPSDLFTLNREELAALPRMAETSAQNLLDALDKSKDATLDRFINALGIRHVGQRLSQVLADHFGNINDLRQAGSEDLEAIDEIGPEVARSIVSYMSNPDNRKMIDRLLGPEIGFTLPAPPKAAVSSSLAGKTLVLTGTLKEMTREEAKSRINAAGGRVLSSVSRKTDYVVAGAAAGSKAARAAELEVPILSEDEFLKILEE